MRVHRSHMGFTLVEVLISLAISALLLTSLAIAFNASATSYQENQATVEVVSSARQALVRMTTQLRTGSGIAITESNTKCAFSTADSQSISYEYNSGDDKLYWKSGTSQRMLCQNVTSMSFTGTFIADATDYKSIQISMTVQSGTMQYPLSAAVVIRRNLEF
jgi:prepilin-type N-terminal cleavage/methylation domain-containing protein